MKRPREDPQFSHPPVEDEDEDEDEDDDNDLHLALNYLQSVSKSLDGEKYKEFLQTILSFGKKVPGSPSAADVDEMRSAVITIFQGNKELMVRFNAFLRERSGIHAPVIQESIKFLQRIRNLGNAMFQSFTDVMDNFRDEIISPVEASAEVNKVLKDHQDLIDGYKAFDNLSFIDQEQASDHNEGRNNVGLVKLLPTEMDCEHNPADNNKKEKHRERERKWKREATEDNPDASVPKKDSISVNKFLYLKHKIGDERHELDMALLWVNITIEAVEQLMEKIKDKLVRPEQLQLKAHFKDIHLRSIERLYGDYGPDVISNLQNNAGPVLPVILARLKQKREEWSVCHTNFSKVWEEVIDKYYQRLT